MNKLLALIAAVTLGVALPAFAKDEKKGDAKAAATTQKIIDVNSASKKDLMKLDGIGDARAEAIIKGRCYTGKDEIKSKAEVPDAVYDKIKEQIIAKQDTCKAKPAAKKADEKKK